jgi:hypothetical protein
MSGLVNGEGHEDNPEADESGENVQE